MNLTPKFIRFPVLFIIFMVFPAAIFAQPSDDNSSSFVDQLAVQMALKHQLAEAPDEIQAQFEQNPLQLPPEKNEQMLNLYEEAFDSALLLEDFKAALNQEIDDQYSDEIARWLDQPSTEEVTNARREFYSLQGKRKRIITMHEMENEPPTDQRVNRIATLTDTTSAAESSVESSVIILRSVIEALGQLSDERSFSEAQINTIANNFRSQMQAQSNQQFNNQSMIMYYNVADEALENYIAFWGTEAGHWLDNTISTSMQAAYESAAQRFLQSVANDQ